MGVWEHYQSEILPNYVLVVLSRIWAFYCYKGAFVSWGSCNKLGGLKQQKLYSLTFLEAKSPKSRSRQGWLLLEALREHLLHASLLASGGCQRPLAFSLTPRSITPVSSSHGFLPVSVSSPFLFFIMTLRLYLGPTLNPGWSHLKNLNDICKDPISK